MFSITKNGIELDKNKYNWNEETRTLSTTENYLVLDFSAYFGVTFKTGHSCIFKTGDACIFDTGNYCTFKTGHYCTFNTGAYCTFNTGSNCTFTTGHSCTFTTGSNCTFTTGSFCVAIRYDVKGITEIPKDITIKFNSHGVSGYTEVQEDKSKPSNPCNGKVVEVDGKKYKLQEIS
jgi:hypothetical protein